MKKHKTISARFETVDMAEFAAKGLKNNFRNITNIKIRFKNFPRLDYSEHVSSAHSAEHTRVPFWNSAPSGLNLSSGSGVMPAFFYFNRHEEDAGARTPEPETSTESRIIVEADESEAKQISSKLRCLGGYQIEVS